jgi:hypothetical protein
VLTEPEKSAQEAGADDGELVDGAVIYEIPQRRSPAEEQAEEIERLRERVRTLETWLEAAARRRKVEYMQAQRLAMLKALEHDQRRRFVLSLPVALLLAYCAALIALAWLLAGGRW